MANFISLTFTLAVLCLLTQSTAIMLGGAKEASIDEKANHVATFAASQISAKANAGHLSLAKVRDGW